MEKQEWDILISKILNKFINNKWYNLSNVMKKKSLALLTLPLLLASCGANSDTKLSKEQYEKQMNPYFAMFESNYTLVICYNDDSVSVKTDKGKIYSTYTGEGIYYHAVDMGSYVSLTSYKPSGNEYIKNKNRYSLEQAYNYFFSWHICFFSIPYETFEYNHISRQYEFDTYTLNFYSETLTIRDGVMRVRNQKITQFSCILDPNTKLKITFSNIGKTTVTLPDEPEGETLFDLEQLYGFDGNPNEVMDLFIDMMSYIGLPNDRYSFEIVDDSKIQFTLYFDIDSAESYLPSLVMTLLTNGKPLSLCNAHGAYMSKAVDEDRPAYVISNNNEVRLVVPVDQNQNFDEMLLQTRADISENNTEYGSRIGYEDEEGMEEYAYYLYLMQDIILVPPEESFIDFNLDNIVSLFQVSLNDSMFYGGEYGVLSRYILSDYDGDFLIEKDEYDMSLYVAKALAFMINQEENNFNIHHIEQMSY